MLVESRVLMPSNVSLYIFTYQGGGGGGGLTIQFCGGSTTLTCIVVSFYQTFNKPNYVK